MSRREGISFQDAAQEAMAEIDSAESDLAPTAVELAVNSDGEGTVEQPIVESNEKSGLFDKMFVEKQSLNSEDSSKEDSLTFTVDGAQLTMAELKAGYLRQADYTRKTQELSTLRKESENAIVLWNSLQEKPKETIQALWARVSQGKTPVTEEKSDVDIEALVAQRVEEALASDPRVKQVQEQEIMSNINATFAEIEDVNDVKLDNEDRVRVLERAQELETPDLKYAFFTLMEEVRRFEATQRNAEANSSVSGRPTSEAEPASTGTKSYKSVREAMDDTLRESGLSRDTIFIT